MHIECLQINIYLNYSLAGINMSPKILYLFGSI